MRMAWSSSGDTGGAEEVVVSCCTIKHGSFGFEGQTGKLSYAIGSDDFRAYILRFRIGSSSNVNVNLSIGGSGSRRRRSSIGRGNSRLTRSLGRKPATMTTATLTRCPRSTSTHESEIAYCAGSILRGTTIVRPARIKQQAHVLCGGRSIINTALIHPTMPLVFTSGITSDIQVHSAARLHAKDLYAEHSYDSRRDVEIGGTRSRMLLPPRLKFFH